MDQLTAAELLELILLSEAAVDYQVEFWLTVSFGTVIASFAARHLLTQRMRWLISALYLCATFLFVTRWINNAGDALMYVEALRSHGIEMVVGYTSGFGRMVLFFIGTLGTLYFVHVDPDKPTRDDSAD